MIFPFIVSPIPNYSLHYQWGSPWSPSPIGDTVQFWKEWSRTAGAPASTLAQEKSPHVTKENNTLQLGCGSQVLCPGTQPVPLQPTCHTVTWKPCLHRKDEQTQVVLVAVCMCADIGLFVLQCISINQSVQQLFFFQIERWLYCKCCAYWRAQTLLSPDHQHSVWRLQQPHWIHSVRGSPNAQLTTANCHPQTASGWVWPTGVSSLAWTMLEPTFNTLEVSRIFS